MFFSSYKLSDPNKHTLKTLEFMYLCWYIFVDFFLFANRGYDYMHFRIKNSGTENHNSYTYALWVYFTNSFIKNQFKNALISRWYGFNWLIYNKKKVMYTYRYMSYDIALVKIIHIPGLYGNTNILHVFHFQNTQLI